MHGYNNNYNRGCGGSSKGRGGGGTGTDAGFINNHQMQGGSVNGHKAMKPRPGVGISSLSEGINAHSQAVQEDSHPKSNIQTEVSNPSQVTGKGKIKPPYCYRCLTKGHVMSDCTTVICCEVCDSDDHVTKACPFTKGAKPTAVPHGFAVKRMGFYYIDVVGKHTEKEKKEPKTARVKISGNPMTTGQVKSELERLLPGCYQWVVETVKDNEFTTIFPSK